MSKKRIPWRNGRNSPATPRAMKIHPAMRITIRFQPVEFIEILAALEGSFWAPRPSLTGVDALCCDQGCSEPVLQANWCRAVHSKIVAAAASGPAAT
jgi:hypothetical protein